MKITKIISGGQTGADMAGLIVGKNLGIETGGTAPKGWRTELGSNPDLKLFGLKESDAASYPARTKQNIRDSDITLIFGDDTSSGSRLAIDTCKKIKKPYITITKFNQQNFIECCNTLKQYDSVVINVAGNRESGNPGIMDRTIKFLTALIKEVNSNE